MMELAGPVIAFVWLGITFAYAFIFGGRAPYFILYTSIGVLAIGFVWSRVVTKVSVFCYADVATSQVGSKTKVILEVQNNSCWPVPWVQCWVEMPGTFGLVQNLGCYNLSLAPYEKKVISEHLECKLRGHFPWGRILVKTGDLIGVFISSKSFGETRSITVMPYVYDLGHNLNIFTGTLFGETPVTQNPGRSGIEFIGVRKHDDGDGVSRIHWKASAKSQQLLVKEFQVQKTYEFVLFLDIREDHHCSSGPDGSLEKAVTLAASVAATATRAGYGAGLFVLGAERTALPINSGKGHFNLVLETLVNVKPGQNVCMGEVIKNDISFGTKKYHAVVVTGLLDQGLAEALLYRANHNQGATVLLFALETFGEIIDLDRRAKLVSNLRAGGIRVIIIERNYDFRLVFRGLDYGI